MSDDLISRQAAIDALEKKKDKKAKGDISGFYNKIIQNDIDTLMLLPSADRPQGEWELECDGEGECDNLYRCPFCGNRVGCEAYDKPKFCDECGADLKGADDE